MADVRTYGLALLSCGAALASTRLTWPLLAHTPFILLFGAVFAASNWGSEGASVVALILAALASPYIAPPAARPAFDDSSLIIFIVGGIAGNRIIGARRRVEKKLAASEAQLRASWDSAAVGTALLSSYGQVERLNPAMERLLDYPSAAWAGTSFGYFTHKDDAAAERARFDELMAGTVDDYQIEQRFRRRDGALIWGHVTMSAVKSAEGRASGALMMVEDITSRRMAEDALRASEERLRGLFEAVPVGLFEMTPAGVIVAANPALTTMLGHNAAATLQQLNVADLYADPGMRAAVRQSLATHRPEIPNTQTLLERGDGRFITAIIGARAVRDKAGVIRSYEGIVLDLSDRQALEAQLDHAQKQDALGRLVSGVAHDFSNLLTAIGGSAELALQAAGTETQRDDLEEVLKASQRATVLTRQLMTFSRREKIEPQVLDLNGIIADAGSLLRRLIGPEVQMLFALAEDLRPIKAQPGQIEQILVNLAVNARDAMPDGGRLEFETVNITSIGSVSGRRKGDANIASGDYVRLSVKDTGIGMDDVTKARLFEPFFTTKEPGNGTGLGLATVNRIVSRSGGRIWVKSAPGAGTTFMIEFPAV
jgi:two-component system cell cycle sensor histidine kinase/response regulator CckA